MLICDICTQEVPSEDDMKRHLVLAHLERDCCCPFCTITGLTYDELRHHINTAHTDALEPWSSDEEESGKTQVPTSTSSTLESPQTNINDLNCHIEQTNYKLRLPFKKEQNNNIKPNTLIECIELEESIRETSESPPLACSAESVYLPLSSECSEVCSTRCNTEVNVESDSQASASAHHIDYNMDSAMECPFCCEMKTSIEELEHHVKVEHTELLDTPTKGNNLVCLLLETCLL